MAAGAPSSSLTAALAGAPNVAAAVRRGAVPRRIGGGGGDDGITRSLNATNTAIISDTSILPPDTWLWRTAAPSTADSAICRTSLFFRGEAAAAGELELELESESLYQLGGIPSHGRNSLFWMAIRA